MKLKKMPWCVVGNRGFNIELDEIMEDRMQVAGAFKGSGMKDISRVFVVPGIELQLPGIRGLRSLRVSSACRI